MRCGVPLLATVLVVLAAFHGTTQANVYCFTVEGTYASGLLASDGVTPLFSAGDAFTIQGKFDMDLQPTKELKSGSETLVDASVAFPPYFLQELDYGTITEMGFTGMSLDEINSNYPSNEGDLGDDAVKNAAYVASQYQYYLGMETSSLSMEIVDDYTSLVIRDDGTPDGWIYYNYRAEMEGTVLKLKHDTILLNITSVEISECTATIPLPGSILLLASGVAGLAPIRRKLRLQR